MSEYDYCGIFAVHFIAKKLFKKLIHEKQFFAYLPHSGYGVGFYN